ncbi:MAG: radical SAM protein, partial [Desulfobacula sp.]|nr:radical SAM protein [Desulfobacula sp.]
VYYVGAVLRENGYDVEILNWHNIDKTPHLIQDTLVQKNPDVIGISILHANRWGGIEIAGIAKQVNREVKIVFGGVGATFLWEHLLTHFEDIDFTVTGEGEYTFLNLIKWLEKKDYKGIENVKGIAFKKKGKIIKNPEREVIPDLDNLPNPAKYFKYQHVALTRGCPANCTFCGSPKIWGKKVRAHSSEYFVNQLEFLYKKGITFFYFSDDTFTFKKDLVIDICKKILERDLKISWVAISRVNFINEEILYWMRMAGCSQISYGVESGSKKIRDILNKNITKSQIKKTFKATASYGILPRAYFIYGSPEENWDTIGETIDLIHDIKPLNAIFYILDIFPGTRLYSDFKKRTGSTDDIWLKKIEDIMYFETDSSLSKEMIMAFGWKLRTDFYENLADFADQVELVDREELFELHADFLSKLAMTFSHGDYAKIEAVKNKDLVAEKLYKRSLDYQPVHRAFLGLGMIAQKKKKFNESIEILSKGLDCFPENEQLNMCMGINYMNLNEYDKALPYFLKHRGSKEADYFIAICSGKLE